MKNPSIIFICALVILMSCTKSNEVHPEQGDGFNEIITVGLDSVNVKYFRADFDELDQIRFKYWYHLAPDTAEAIMERNDSFFELCLNDLLGDTLYYYRYVLYPGAIVEEIKQFHTQAYDAPEPPTISLPIVNTVDVTEITANSAICGGVVANDGGATVSDRGGCWSVVENPSLSDSYVSAGPGMGSFTVLMDGLGTNTTYHVRAYAVNEKGTAYGLDKVFVI